MPEQKTFTPIPSADLREMEESFECGHCYEGNVGKARLGDAIRLRLAYIDAIKEIDTQAARIEELEAERDRRIDKWAELLEAAEKRAKKAEQRIEELEADAVVLRKECGKFSDRNTVALRQRAEKAEAELAEWCTRSNGQETEIAKLKADASRGWQRTRELEASLSEEDFDFHACYVKECLKNERAHTERDEALDAVRDYGQHKPDCGGRSASERFSGCGCGWDWTRRELLDKHEGKDEG